MQLRTPSFLWWSFLRGATFGLLIVLGESGALLFPCLNPTYQLGYRRSTTKDTTWEAFNMIFSQCSMVSNDLNEHLTSS